MRGGSDHERKKGLWVSVVSDRVTERTNEVVRGTRLQCTSHL